MDPWNGSGITTTAAGALGYSGIGYDLNPVMVVVARAGLVASGAAEHTEQLTRVLRQGSLDLRQAPSGDPLLQWLSPKSVAAVRSLEQQLRAAGGDPSPLALRKPNVESMDSLLAFFYVALFRSLRSLLAPLYATNPTWLKKPKSDSERLNLSRKEIVTAFLRELAFMSSTFDGFGGRPFDPTGSAPIAVGSSLSLPEASASVDLILTSPPYCTRIDYAVATSAELGVLGIGEESGFGSLRSALMGTSTVLDTPPQQTEAWGTTCNTFLDAMRRHPSKASETYYYKNHLQYFHDLFESVRELARVLRPAARCIVVAQGSYYKALHNDLQNILVEMSEYNGLVLEDRVDFHSRRTMAGRNREARKYRQHDGATESVLCFREE